MKIIVFISLLLVSFNISYAGINNSLFLNGTSDYVQVSDNSALQITGDLSVEAWINPCDIGAYHCIVNKNNCAGIQGGYHFGVTDGKLTFIWTSDGDCGNVNSVTSDNIVVTTGVWSHVAVVHTNTSVTLYLNGSAISSTLTGSYGSIYNNTAPLLIGVYRGIAGNYGNYFSGRLDEISIWNKALTGVEISQNYQQSLAGNETNLVAYYDMENVTASGDGITLSNAATTSGSALDGTSVGTINTPYANFSDDLNDYVVLNGTSDYVQVSDNSALQITGDLSVEAWINPCDISGYHCIVNKNDCAGNQGGYHFGVKDGMLTFIWTGDGDCGNINSVASADIVVTAGVWSHVAVVHTNTSVTLYLNGSVISSNLTGSNSSIYNSTAPLLLGVYKGISGNYGNYFSGRLDEIRIWDKALTGVEISQNYQQSLAGNESNLVAYYDMENIGSAGEGVSIPNIAVSSGSALDGTTVGSPSTPSYDNAICTACAVVNAVINPSNENVSELKFYPNPFSSLINISLDNFDAGNAKVIISNYMNEELLNKDYSLNGKELQLDLSTFENGCYLLKIIQDNKSGYSLIIKAE